MGRGVGGSENGLTLSHIFRRKSRCVIIDRIDRRALLAGLAVGSTPGVSGCLGDATLGDSDDGNGAGDDGANQPEAFELTVESTEVEGPVSLSAEVISTVTPDSRGELRVAMVNEADEPRAFECFPGSVNPFHGESFREVNGEESVWVRGGGNPEYMKGCWVADGTIDDFCHVPDIDPGEEIDGTVGVFGARTPRGDEELATPCMMTGTYEAEREFELHETAPEPDIGDYVEDAWIGMTISLEVLD